MKRFFLVLTLSMLAVMTCFGQHKKHHAKAKVKKETAKPMPDWYKAHGASKAAHVYFPDYYAFYDANRQGFVFWAHDRWEFSPSVPMYLDKVDLRKSRIKILNGLSLDLQPEQNYPNYMKMYPAQPTGEPINVPVPNIMNNK